MTPIEPTAKHLPAPPPLLAVLLAALTALGPFCIDTYLPSFPEIAHSLQASPLAVQQTLTAYLAPFTVMTLWHGAISDSLGRRRVVLVALGLFLFASLGAALAPSIGALWLCRALQGITAGAGIVIGRAIVRDLFDGAAAQKLISHIAIMFAVAPVVAPMIGGWLHVWFGWRSVFVFLAAFALLMLLLCWRYLPESLPPERRHPLHPGPLLRAYGEVLTHRGFVGLSLAIACNFGGFFLYVMSAPVFLLRHLHRAETEFFWLFGPAMAGMMLGSWLSGRLAHRQPPRRTLRSGFVIMSIAATANLIINLWLPPQLPWSVLPIFVYCLGQALTIPVLTLQALDHFPHRRGLAASCQAFLQASLSTLSGAFLAPLLWGSTLSLASGMALLLLGGTFLTWLGLRPSEPPAPARSS